MKQTPQEKEKKKRLNEILVVKNRCVSSFSFKNLRTYGALIKEANLPESDPNFTTDPAKLQEPITVQYIKDFFQQYFDKVEKEFAGDGAIKKQDLVLEVPLEKSKPVEEDTDPLKLEEKLPPSPLQKCTLFPFQERAAKEILDAILHKNQQGRLLLAPVGTGKTFVIGALIRRLLDINWHKGKTVSPWPFVYVTRSSIVAQTERVLRKLFNIDTERHCKILNIEQLRASFGELMVRAETVHHHGEPRIIWKWRPGVHPLVILWDECQALKNTNSQQSEIAQAFNNINDVETFQIFFSATPFMRVCEAKCFAVATRLKTKYGLSEAKLSNDHWADFAYRVAGAHTEPTEYSPAAVDRLMKHLDEYITQIKNVRSQFKAINKVQIIDFSSPAERKFYDDAWNRYLAEKARIEGLEGLSEAQSRMTILVQFLKFRMAAELCRAPYLAKAMWHTVNEGQAAVCAVNFKGTIRKIVDVLVNDYNVPRDDISLIWGGGKTQPTKKQKEKQAMVANSALIDFLKQQGIGLDIFDLENVDDYVEEKENPELRLGAQSLKERQKEIDKFQGGKSHYCIYTFKSGGVGLSLHHTDEFTKEKCRRKKSGYVYTEDIPSIPTRQRVVFLAPTYSAIELVQGLGRAPRLTSLSDTPQTIVFYRGTIEEQVAAIVSIKLRCLRRVVRTRESWEDVIVGGVPAEEHYKSKEIPKDVSGEQEDDTPDMFGEDEEESE